MQIIKPSIKVELHYPNRFDDPDKFLEKAGRIAYKSEDKITEVSSKKFLKMICKRDHLSVLEHITASAFVICDRSTAQELTRHRIASYTMESQRYVDYTKSKHGNNIIFIHQPNLEEEEMILWEDFLSQAELTYFSLRARGVKPEIARSVLPNCTKTELIITANLRSWMNILELRCARDAHPSIRLLMLDALEQFNNKIDIIFNNLTEKYL
jgi:thymidylate synthase (FAD)